MYPTPALLLTGFVSFSKHVNFKKGEKKVFANFAGNRENYWILFTNLNKGEVTILYLKFTSRLDFARNDFSRARKRMFQLSPHETLVRNTLLSLISRDVFRENHISNFKISGREEKKTEKM